MLPRFPDLPGGGKLSHAAIIGLDGGVWAQSPEFPQLSPEQVQALLKGVDEPNSLGGTGIKVGGPAEEDVIKFFLIPSEAGSVLRGRFKGDGIVIKKTKQTLIIGISKEPVTGSECSVRVEEIGDHLIGTDY